MFLVANQALVDLFNGAINSPFTAAGNVVFYTNAFEDVTHERETPCPYWLVMFGE